MNSFVNYGMMTDPTPTSKARETFREFGWSIGWLSVTLLGWSVGRLIGLFNIMQIIIQIGRQIGRAYWYQ